MNAEATLAAATLPNRYQVDDLVIDLRTRRITRAGVDLEVTSLSFDLLLALVRASPSLVTFDALMGIVWPRAVVSPETLTQRVKLLRQALGDSGESPRYVLAVRGHGYRMATPAVPLSEPPQTVRAVGGDKERVQSPRAAPAVASARRWPIAVATLCVIAAAVAAWWAFERNTNVQAPQARAAAAAAASPPGSIAVLPFANLTGDPTKEYLSDGMAEEMINALGQVPGLKVPARTSSFAYKGRNVDVRTIAQDLGVGTILEGSVRSAGERIRITAQMVNAQSGYQIWSQSYDREFDDLFKLQDDLAAAVVQAFGSSLKLDLPGSTARKLPTLDVDAYEFYLQAESVVNGTPVSFLAAITLYDEALARDPAFARALSGRAMNRAALVWTGSPLSRGLEDAQRDAERALALDPAEARPHAVLASISALRGDWSAAETSFRAAIAASPLDAELRGRYAITVLLPTGQLRKASTEATEARRLAPGNGFTAAMLAFVDQALGADQDALGFADLAVSLGADARQMAPVYASAAARRRSYSDAAEHAVDGLPPAVRDADGTATVRRAYAALGDSTQKQAALAALAELTGTPAWESADPRGKLGVLYLYAAFDAVDELYDEMNRMLRQGDGIYPEIIAIGSLWSPEMRPFRRDPRFQALVERLGLIDYWTQFGPPDDCALAGTTLSCN
jgi:TolB-like protein/DNA-binding winged helix-turn-helix (wHTH) protein/Flp pilus assembly protein TadD